MMKRFLLNSPGLLKLGLLLSLLCACSPENERGLSGQLLFADQPLAAAQVEIYLKSDKDRSVQPFAVATTDAKGNYRVSLPEGRYFVIGKQRESLDDGRTRMLMAESPVNPHQVSAGMARVPSFNLVEMGREGLAVADAATGISGRISHKGEPVSRAFVYVYSETAAGLIGPSYGEAVQTDKDGTFTINLPVGRYSLVARKRADGSRSGRLSPGDLNADYPGNPVEVRSGERLQLQEFSLEGVDADVYAQRQTDGVFAKTDIALHGQIVDAEGQPVSAVYVLAYLDSRMVGKPVHVSVATAADGQFSLFLDAGGTYYIGARSAIGGPLEPGEWVGTFDGQPDHSVAVTHRQSYDLGLIVVKEFW
ncbi:MAG: carboxypeptidase regulatory-like domain-containing protein [Desulfuromonadales bacterium]|nr:carboxypeptidase regulatory-like domain-containing protein [Desulfuromonadales bacterium]